MADEVIIGNVGGQDGVASEATLQALVRAIERMGNQRGQKGAGNKVQDLHNKALQTGTTAANAQTDSIKENTGAVRDSTSAAQNFGRSLGNMAARGIGQVVSSLAGMTKSLIQGETSVTAYAAQIPVIGSIIAPMTQYLENTMKSFQEMSRVGGNFNNDLTQIRLTAAEMRLGLDDFTAFVRGNSEKLATFGGTVTGGALEIAKLNKALGAQREEMLNMGFTMTDINEALVEYAHLNRAGSRAQLKTQQQREQEALAAADYAKNLKTLASLTGQDVKSMQDKIAAQQNDIAFQARLARLAPAERDKVLAGMAEAMAMGGETGAEYFKQQFLGLPPLTERTQLFASTMGESARVIQNMNRSAQNTSVTLEQFRSGSVDRMVDFIAGASNAANDLEGVLAAAAAGAEGPGKELNRILLSLGKNINDYKNADGTLNRERLRADLVANQEAAAQRHITTQSMASFNENITKLIEAFQKLFIESGVLEMLSGAIKKTAEFIGFIADSIKGLPNAISGPIVIAGLVAAIATLFAARAVVGALSSGLNNAVSSRVSRLFGGGAAAAARGASSQGGGALTENVRPSQAGKGFGSAISNISKGLGEGISAVLQGLATGISAFANPKVMLGAVGLAGAIVVIGAAVAGATWMIGKALPTFAEGLKGFADIDGGNLLKVAGGVAALGAAMAAMGAGQLVGAVTGALGGLAEGVASFFGVRPPLEKLKEFGDMNIDADRVKSNAQAVVEYGKAMAALGAGGAVGSIGNVAAAAADGLVKFFGGEVRLPWARIKEFESESFDTPKIKSNSEAIVAFSEAMSKIPVVPRERIGGLIGSVADFFLGAQQTPWAQVTEFGQLQLPADRIKSNAEALAAFGEAIAKMPASMPTGRTGGLVESITSFFGGERRMPWNELVAFGQLQLPVTSIKSNAEALTAFGNALSAFRGTGTGGPISIPPGIAESLGRLTAVGSGDGLQRTAAGLQAIANVQNLQTTLGSLNALDATKLTSYNSALRDLTRVLADLNKELSNENRGGLFGGGDARANAGEILRNISVNTSAGAGNTSQLNETLVRIFEVLNETKALNEKIERNTKGSVNIAGGDVSALRQ